MNRKYIRKIFRKRWNAYTHCGYKVTVHGFKEVHFLDIDYGSLDNALKEAYYYRNDLFAKIYTDPDYIGNLSHKRNNVGIVGIVRENGYYRSSIGSRSERKCKTFSISVYGERQALLKAIEYRFSYTNKGGFTEIPIPEHLKFVGEESVPRT